MQPVRYASGRNLGAPAVLVPALVVSGPLVAGLAARYSYNSVALHLEGAPEPIGVVTPPAQQSMRVGQPVQQRCRPV